MRNRRHTATSGARSFFRFLAFVLLGALFLTGCSLFGAEERAGSKGVTAKVQADAIVVENHRSEKIWTFLSGQKARARILWKPSLERKALPPKEQKTVPYDEIPMVEGEENIIVHWWTAVEKGDERVPGEISSFAIDI